MSGLEKDTIIGLHEAKIKNLTIIEGLRSEQLINANIENTNLNKEIKRLKLNPSDDSAEGFNFFSI